MSSPAAFESRPVQRPSRWITWVPLLTCLALIPQYSGAQPLLVDLATEAGLPVGEAGGSVPSWGNLAVFDCDNDGDQDVLLLRDGTLFLGRNESVAGNPAFEDATEGIDEEVRWERTSAAAAGDVNGDGLIDIFLGVMGANRLLFNTGNCTFEDVTHTHLDGWMDTSLSVAMADVEGDGDLDVYTGSFGNNVELPFPKGERDHLLINDGHGRFTDRTKDWGIDSDGAALAVAWSDVDNDGDPDLLVANDYGPAWRPNLALRNDGPAPGGGWVWTDVSEEWGFNHAMAAMGIAVLDANGDGHLDYLVTNTGRDVLLGGPAVPDGLVDITDSVGIGGEFTPFGYRVKWGLAVADITGDGVEDVYIKGGFTPVTGYIVEASQPDICWALDGEGGAQWIDDGAFPYMPEEGRGVVPADFDGDGRIDLITNSRESIVRLLMGTADPQNIHVELIATVSAPGAPTARLVIKCGDSLRIRELTGGGSQGSNGPPGHVWMAFPTDCPDGVATLQVRWPSGVNQIVEDVAVGDHVEITEPDWIRLEPKEVVMNDLVPATLEVEPRGPGGIPLGTGHSVMVAVGDAAPIPAVDLGDGRYTLEVTPLDSPGELLLSLSVNQIPVPAHPTVRTTLPPGPSMIVYPGHLIVGQTSFVTVSHPGLETVVLEATGASIESEVSLEEGGTLFTIIPAASGQDVVLSAVVDGTPLTDPVTKEVHPPVSQELSTVRMNSPYLALGGESPEDLIISAQFRDANNWPVRGEFVSVTARVDGEVVSTLPVGPGYLVLTQITIPASELAVGSEVSVWVDDSIAGPPVPIQALDAFDSVLDVIDAVETRFAALGCRADGDDLGRYMAQFRDAGGHVLPNAHLIDGLSSAMTGVEPLGTLGVQQGLFFGEFKCTGEPGIGEIAFLWNGEPTGAKGTFRLLPPPPLHVALDQTYVAAVGSPALPGDSIYAVVRPRDENGNLLGSGLDVGLRVLESNACIPVPYCGHGRYCADVMGPEGNHDAEAIINGASSGAVVTLSFEPDPDGEKSDWSPLATGSDRQVCDSPRGQPDAGGTDATSDIEQPSDAGKSDDSAGQETDASNTTGPDGAGTERRVPSSLEPDGNGTHPDLPDGASNATDTSTPRNSKDDGCAAAPPEGRPGPWVWIALALMAATCRRRRSDDAV